MKQESVKSILLKTAILAGAFLFGSVIGIVAMRQGYATGIYAGYLIIPATFSESIVSLNNIPVRSEISYAINSNLREDVKEEAIYDVLALMDEINSGVSYMYLHSVLDDFHTAQDAANTVMNNDIEERDAIDAIQANDLVALVPVAEFTEIENTLESQNDNYYFFSGYLLDEEGKVVKDENNESVLLTSLLEEYRQDLDDPSVKKKY